MAEEKKSLLNVANAAGAVGGVVVGASSMFLAMGDTSPKSLEDMAKAMNRIAVTLEKSGELDAASASAAADLVNSAQLISQEVAKKAVGIELPGMEGVLLPDEGVSIAKDDTKSLVLGNGDRVSVTYLYHTSAYRLNVNGKEQYYQLGARVYESEDKSCFVEILRSDADFSKVVVRPVCA